MKRITALAGIILIAASTTTAILASTASPIDSAKPGSTIIWPAGDGQTLSIVDKHFDPSIIIDGSRATFSKIVIRNSSGVYIKDGTVIGPGRPSIGINIQRSKNVTVDGMTVTGAVTGIIAGASEDIIIKNNKLVGLISDGIQIPLSRKVLIESNSCSNFNPSPKVYDSSGKMIKDGDHADCIQSWSRLKAPPVADLKILNNRIEGKMQGIFLGNGVRDGVSDGGYDRVVIEGNQIRVTSWHGISVSTARGLIVRNNQISTVPGSTMTNPPYYRISAWLKIVKSSDVIACGNSVENAKDRTGLERCPRETK